MRVLVIGGCGFIGSHAVDELLAQGLDVVVLDRGSEAFRSPLPAVSYIRGDIGNRGQLEEIFSSGIDSVVHLASSTLPKTSNDDPIYDVQMNLIETLALLDICCKHNVRKIVFASSGGTVYGMPQVLPISEEHPTNPLCSYGIVKLAIEKYLFLYQQLYGLQYVAIRMSNPYGVRQNPESIQGVIPVFMKKMLQRDVIRLWGDGSVVRDFVNIKDVAQLIYSAIISDSCGVFNAGSGVGVSINSIIDLIASQLNIVPTVVRETSRKFDIPYIVLNCEKASAVFSWKPMINLETGILEMVDWMVGIK